MGKGEARANVCLKPRTKQRSNFGSNDFSRIQSFLLGIQRVGENRLLQNMQLILE